MIFVALANLILFAHAALPHSVFPDASEETARLGHRFARGTSAQVVRDDFLAVLAAEACSGHHHHGGSSAKCIISESCAAAVRFYDNERIVNSVERASDDLGNNNETCSGMAVLPGEATGLLRRTLRDRRATFTNLIIRSYALSADGLRAPPMC